MSNFAVQLRLSSQVMNLKVVKTYLLTVTKNGHNLKN